MTPPDTSPSSSRRRMTPSDTPSILYASVAKGPTVLAELNAIDPGVGGDAGDLSSLAAKCVEAAPLYHRLYTHTAGGRIYAFLMDPPLLFFAIANESLGRHETLLFLRRLPDAISSTLARRGCIDRASSLCYQEELLPVLRGLVFPVPSHEDKPPPTQFSPPSDVPLTAETPSESEEGRRDWHKKGKKKKKKKRSDEAESRMEISVATDREGNAGLDMDIRGRKSLKQLWRWHVWMVLIFDLVVCGILFAIWLSVCKGFQCVAG